MLQTIFIPDIDTIIIGGMSIKIHSKYYVESFGLLNNLEDIFINLAAFGPDLPQFIRFIFRKVGKFSISINSIPDRFPSSPRLSFIGITSDDWDMEFYGIAASKIPIISGSIAMILENNSYIRVSFKSLDVEMS